MGCGSSTPEVETVPEQTEDNITTEGETTPQEANDPVATLIAETQGTVKLTVWAAEEDQDMVNGFCEAFTNKYSEIDFDIVVGVESESTAKDTILTDAEAAADVFSFAEIGRASCRERVSSPV